MERTAYVRIHKDLAQVKSKVFLNMRSGGLGLPPQQAFCIMDSHMHRLPLLSQD